MVKLRGVITSVLPNTRPHQSGGRVARARSRGFSTSGSGPRLICDLLRSRARVQLSGLFAPLVIARRVSGPRRGFICRNQHVPRGDQLMNGAWKGSFRKIHGIVTGSNERSVVVTREGIITWFELREEEGKKNMGQPHTQA